MNRLQSELSRLYLHRAPSHAKTDVPSLALIDPSNRVRALVMELTGIPSPSAAVPFAFGAAGQLTGPPDWEALSRVWLGVQTELELPAPAIAVSGVDGLQLWFSLAEPIAVSKAHAFLDRLRQRFLADVASRRVRLMPAADASPQHQERHAPLVPALQEQTGNWSAFLAPDLVPVFADTPWLDIPPNEEGQASLLRSIQVTEQAVFEAAFEKLAPAEYPSPSLGEVSVAASSATPRAHAQPEPTPADADPKRFLLQVMHDDTVALALRIEAAKALLQHAAELRLRQGH